MRAVALAFMEGPRSACRVNWPGETRCLAKAVFEQRLEQAGAFRVGDTPSDDPSAEDVDDHVEVEVGPFCGSHQLGDVPGPDLVGAFGEQFRLLIDGMAQLPAAFSDFVMVVEDPIHGADRAVVGALVEQAGVDFRRGQVDEVRFAQKVAHRQPLLGGQRPFRLRPWPWGRRRPVQAGTVTMNAGARNPERGTGSGIQALSRCQSDDGLHQGSPSIGPGGSPGVPQLFFGGR